MQKTIAMDLPCACQLFLPKFNCLSTRGRSKHDGLSECFGLFIDGKMTIKNRVSNCERRDHPKQSLKYPSKLFIFFAPFPKHAKRHTKTHRCGNDLLLASHSISPHHLPCVQPEKFNTINLILNSQSILIQK